MDGNVRSYRWYQKKKAASTLSRGSFIPQTPEPSLCRIVLLLPVQFSLSRGPSICRNDFVPCGAKLAKALAERSAKDVQEKVCTRVEGDFSFTNEASFCFHIPNDVEIPPSDPVLLSWQTELPSFPRYDCNNGLKIRY